jgi:exopolysaccharide production protein ExoZ
MRILTFATPPSSKVIANGSPRGNGQVPALDIVRFTTSVIVMLFHICYWGNGNVPPETDLLNNFWWFGWVGVEIFFTLSGFVIAFSAYNTSAIKFAIGRLIRLFPTIWLCATITFTLTILLASNVGASELTKSYINTLWMNPKGGHIDIVYWTLTVEISFYLFVFLALHLRDFNFMLKGLMVLGTISATFNTMVFCSDILHKISPALAAAVEKMDQMHTFRLVLVKHGVFFALGALIWNRSSSSRIESSNTLLIIFILGATLEVWSNGLSHIHQLGAYHTSIFVVLVAWWLGLAGITLGSTQPTTKWITTHMSSKMVRQLGLLTFPLYLLHNNGGLQIKDTLRFHGLSNNHATLVAALLIVVVASIVSKYIEPPVAQWLKYRLQHFAR